MINKFNLPFDKIYVLNYACDKKRYNCMKDTIKYLNAENITEFIYTTPCPDSIKEYTDKKIFGKEQSLKYFSVGWNHYNAIKTSYELGHNRILILEDDIDVILYNNDLVQETFDLIKENDYPIIKLHTQTHMLPNNSMLSLFDNNDNGVQEFTNKDNLTKECGAEAYTLNRKGMELMIETFNKDLQSPDSEMGLIKTENIYLTKYSPFNDSENFKYSNIWDKKNNFKMINKFKLPFDKIFVLCFSEDKERCNKMKETIKYLNGENITEYIYTNQVPYHMKHYLDKNIWGDEDFHYDYSLKTFSCIWNHYDIIKTSYELGYNRILILEDDVIPIYLNDDLIQETFNMITDDYPIIKLHTHNIERYSINNCLELFDNNDNGVQEFTNKETDIKGCGSEAYTLNRKGMELLLEIYNKQIITPDVILNLVPTENVYLTKYSPFECSDLAPYSNINLRYNEKYNFKFKLPFDKIFILCYAKSTNRYNFMKKVIKELNAEDITEFIYTAPGLDFMKNYLNNYLDGCSDNDEDDDYSLRVFSCAWHHYNAIKTAYDLGYKRVLILEDDVDFTFFNKKLIQETFDLVTDDYPIMKFVNYLFETPWDRVTNLELFDNNDNGIQEFTNKFNKTVKRGGAEAYTLNREGMELILKVYNEKMQAADAQLYFVKENVYTPKYNILSFINPEISKSNIDLKDRYLDDIKKLNEAKENEDIIGIYSY